MRLLPHKHAKCEETLQPPPLNICVREYIFIRALHRHIFYSGECPYSLLISTRIDGAVQERRNRCTVHKSMVKIALYDHSGLGVCNNRTANNVLLPERLGPSVRDCGLFWTLQLARLASQPTGVERVTRNEFGLILPGSALKTYKSSPKPNAGGHHPSLD